MFLAQCINEKLTAIGDKLVFTYLGDGESESLTWTAVELNRKALGIQQKLGALAVPGDRVVLEFRSAAAFVPALIGCLYSGVVVVPAPASLRNRNSARAASIIEDAQAVLVLTDNPGTRLDTGVPTLEISAQREVHAIGPKPTNLHFRDDDPAVLQYTSGSTGTPKGVIITQRNLRHNVECLHQAYSLSQSSVIVSWLPFYHDMGLLSILCALPMGSRIIMLPPPSFLQRPRRWLAAISNYGGTHTAAPNFAYDLCTRTIGESANEGLSLTTLQAALNGGEPVRSDTVTQFVSAFEKCGFKKEVLLPSYGLAESTVLVSVGRTFTGDIRIVDASTCLEQAEGEEGEIWVSGPSVAAGYWNRPEETAAVFQARLTGDNRNWLRTGDLGRLSNGELQITGRLKDIIIIRGTNHYPQDIESTVAGTHEALETGAGAAFSVDHEGEERLVVAHEIRRDRWRSFNAKEVFYAVRRSIAATHGLQVFAISLLRPSACPKTSSGKIQRRACRTAFLAGELETLAEWRAGTESSTGSPARVELEEWLVSRVSLMTGVPSSEIDRSRPFVEYGLDSSHAVRLSGELEEHLGARVSATAAFDHPTIHALALHLSGAAPATTATIKSKPHHAKSIAIVGMGCRFPGAESPTRFCEMLFEGRDGIGDIPSSRWDIDRYYDPAATRPGTMYTRRGAFLDQVDGFDAAFFNITPREAAALDPQQRLWLEVAWEALEHAGIAPSSLRGTRTGVFAGQCFDDYMRLSTASGAASIDAYTGLGSSRPASAARLSYLLGLSGPALHVDTSCSSSAMAIHLACQSLRAGECDIAIAGGVNLILAPESSVGLCQLSALSRDGRSKTFDAAADGYGRGEGCGVVVLRRLDEALEGGARVEAVILGSAANHDGHTNGFTAPSGPAQQQVIRQAIENAGIAPAEVGYVEAHGTGTLLGDPIEVNALGNVFFDRSRDQPLLIGSVKTNIGHLEAAAAVAGVLKTVFAVREGRIPPHLHLHNSNPHIDWDALPVQVTSEVTPWPEWHARRIAGISSFGMSGTNVHLIIENAPPVASQPRVSGPQVLALSARSRGALNTLIHSFDDHLGRGADLRDTCYTANTGRTHLRYRFAAVGETVDSIRASLQSPEIFETNSEPPEVPSSDYGDVATLAAHYRRGAAVDWPRVYRGQNRPPVALPTYPFERRRYWIGENSARPRHPLLGNRMPQAAHLQDHFVWQTDLDLTRLSFLNGHRIHGNHLMPVSGFIEMARAAASEGLNFANSTLTDLELHHALVLPATGTRTMQVSLVKTAHERATFHAWSRHDHSAGWVLHASATVRANR